MAMTELVTPDAAAIEAELAPVVTQAKGITVHDAPSHEAAQIYIAEIARRERFVKEQFAEPKKKAHEAHKAITALEARLLEPLTAARRVVNGKLTSYEDAERRRAEEAAAAERARLAAAEEERRLLDASMAEEAGDVQAAEEIMAEPVIAPVVEARPEIAKVAGVTTATRYRAEVTDLHAMIVHVAAHPEFINLVIGLAEIKGCQGVYASPGVNTLARSLREAMSIPGVRVVRERDTRVRTA